ncbi:MAG: hypothetical protein B7X90_16460 [Novosphingobium sp. 17-62-19]|uniref:diguanylate cyclase domain-containing protein n=1 Tax=Novosphingobium sp. 17-62-19 TaxID=1970406 RepID=UPI000BC840DB|nr:diguanylate cyclase [Novosphingobium sp. 17-62-19]OYX96732.1 MAG: hypothetical protein B7Y74_00355 [Novosphingobium sp. 35-62-5]OZA17014.1 MAG: hypothetical protein B7X90_16460 [Novosphingobium sp. 17-62-19]HQS97394.1 diguanylate cyclase [Novosphingobium sp.]
MYLLEKLLESQDEGLADLVEAGSVLFDCPMAVVSALDTDCQHFLVRRGIAAEQTPIGQSFCRIAVAQDSLLVVPDTHLDARFRENPLVTGDPNIRFYAGAPLRLRLHPDAPTTGIGAFCIIDSKPRTFTSADSARLISFARGVEAMLQSRLSSIALSEDAVLLKAMLADKERAQRQFRQAERLTSIGCWRLDLITGGVAWSEGIYDIHRVPVTETEKLDDALAYYPPADRERLEAALDAASRTGACFELELDFIAANGAHKRVRTIGEPELEQGRVVALIGVLQDVTERHRSMAELSKRANTDEVTLIASRHKFVSYVDSCVDKAKISREPLALMLIDLDHFKQVNDTLGHAAGDDVLRAVAMVLRSPWLKDSLAARLGGDEFALVLTDPGLIANLPDIAAQLTEQLRFPRRSKTGDFIVSATIGCSELDGPADSRHDLLQRADRALYRAKAQGRGSFSIDTPQAA